MTDGDGTFSIARQNNQGSLVYKVALSRYNLIFKQVFFNFISWYKIELFLKLIQGVL